MHSGHYVSYIRKNNKWVLYNDAKVAETNDPVLGKAFIYIFKRM
jgi:ubiquitin carboxyl-terminal hydrolase 5/13